MDIFKSTKYKPFNKIPYKRYDFGIPFTVLNVMMAYILFYYFWVLLPQFNSSYQLPILSIIFTWVGVSWSIITIICLWQITATDPGSIDRLYTHPLSSDSDELVKYSDNSEINKNYENILRAFSTSVNRNYGKYFYLRTINFNNSDLDLERAHDPFVQEENVSSKLKNNVVDCYQYKFCEICQKGKRLVFNT